MVYSVLQRTTARLSASTGVAMTTKPLRQQDGNPPDGEPVDDLAIEYPSSDGEPMAESDLQYVPLTETVSALRVRFSDRSDVYVAGNMLVYYRMNDPSASVAPDVFAVLGTTGNHPRDSWPSGVRARLPTSSWRSPRRAHGVGTLRRRGTFTLRWECRKYWRFDPTGRCFTPVLVGEMLVDGVYRPRLVSAGASGELRGRSHVLGLDFVVEPELRLRVYDPDTGERLRNHQEAEAEILRLRTLLENRGGVHIMADFSWN